VGLYAAPKRRSSTVVRASGISETKTKVNGKLKGKSKAKVKGVGQECPTHTSEVKVLAASGIMALHEIVRGRTATADCGIQIS
jgi:hypothetical protein